MPYIGCMHFELASEYSPAGDQPAAIAKLVGGLQAGMKDQVLLGATGTGKTFTMANIIQQMDKPTLIMAHNKTLAAQLYSEFKRFFPKNAVEYFVSYYDYYQPEAYVAKTDTFIEKDSSINEQIDRMRHSATRALLERRDVIVISSVSCIYGLGSPELYLQMTFEVEAGKQYDMRALMGKLVELQYERKDAAFERGSFRVRGDVLDIFPSHYEDMAWRLSFFGDELEEIYEFDPLTGERGQALEKTTIFANSHHVTPRPTLLQAVELIKGELKTRIEELDYQGKLLESQRISQRTQFDLEMILEAGTCKGIENYSRYLSGRGKGQPPPTLFEYLPEDALLFVDESHVTVPQIHGMYNGDRARKTTLVEHGFRLPSALDNRPLKGEEWQQMRPQTIHVSATPSVWEMERAKESWLIAHGEPAGERSLEPRLMGSSEELPGDNHTLPRYVAEQIIRPTGLVDPVCVIHPVTPKDKQPGQVDDVIAQCKAENAKGRRVLITTLTKKMAENLTEYMQEAGVKVAYLHSDIDTLERVEILNDLRRGSVEVLIGINLLREGLDLPEVGLVAILDADKAGFLRSETALIQTIGRAARNVDGRVILYADEMTKAMTAALAETERRRTKQLAHNKKHGITPKTIMKAISDDLKRSEESKSKGRKSSQEAELSIEQLRKAMLKAAENLEFEEAARLRDLLQKSEEKALGIAA